MTNYYSWVQTVFRENSGLLLNVEPMGIAFSSVVVNGLNRDLSFLVKKDQMDEKLCPLQIQLI